MIEFIVKAIALILVLNGLVESIKKTCEEVTNNAIKRFESENDIRKICEEAAYAALKRLEAEKAQKERYMKEFEEEKARRKELSEKSRE